MSGRKSQSAKAVRSGSPRNEVAHDVDSERRTVSVEKAAKALGISRAAAYNYAKNGSLPVIRLGSRLLVPKTALEKLLSAA
jgi:excisionase family DNA binding protein